MSLAHQAAKVDAGITLELAFLEPAWSGAAERAAGNAEYDAAKI